MITPACFLSGPGFFVSTRNGSMTTRLESETQAPRASQDWLVGRAVLSGPVRDSLLTHAARAFPHEACGLLVGRVESEAVLITRSVPCQNQASVEERHHRFTIDPRAVINVRRTLRGTPESIVGFYHSHTDGRAVPSALDLDHIRLWPETVWLILPEGGQAPAAPRAWWLDAGEQEVRELASEVAALDSSRYICPD